MLCEQAVKALNSQLAQEEEIKCVIWAKIKPIKQHYSTGKKLMPDKIQLSRKKGSPLYFSFTKKGTRLNNIGTVLGSVYKYMA